MRTAISLLNTLQERYNPDHNLLVEQRSLSDLSYEARDIAKYVRAAMNEVDEHYTQITLNAGNAAKEKLAAKQYGIDYRFQGSVMTRTHIRGVSDIDLLTLTNKFEGTDILEARQILNDPLKQIPYTYAQLGRLRTFSDNFSTYTGNANEDLKQLRLSNETILRAAYIICDTSNPKSIKIRNQHYNRDVDVVTAAWHKSIGSITLADEDYKGVCIYDKEANRRLDPDYPFLSIKRINDRSTETGGRLKKMIRFLKNVVADSDKEIKLHSFEINALCYSFPVDEYANTYYLNLVEYLWLKMYRLLDNESQLNSIKSVDGSEYIFKNKPENVSALRLLKDDVWDLYQILQKK